MAMDQLAWTKAEALHYGGMLMTLRAAVALIVLVSLPVLCKKFEEIPVLLWLGFYLITLGRLCYLPFGTKMPQMAVVQPHTNDTTTDLLGCPMSQKWCLTTPALTLTQIILAILIAAMAKPIGIALTQSLYSKVLAGRPMAKWMGYLASAACLAQIGGTLTVGYVYTNHGIYALFGTLSVILFCNFLWFWLIRYVYV